MPLAHVLSLLMLMFASLPAFAQAGQVPPPSPKQEPPPPPKSGGGQNSGGSSGGASTGVDVNIGEIIGLFRKHAKIHLDVSTQDVQVGVPIAFKTTVTPNARGLFYEFHLSKEKNTQAFQQANPELNYAYPAAGEYKATVVVYQAGKKIGTSNEVKINVKPYSGDTIANKPPAPPPDKVPPPTGQNGSNPKTGQTEPTKTITSIGPAKPVIENPPTPTATNKIPPTEPTKTSPPEPTQVAQPTNIPPKDTPQKPTKTLASETPAAQQQTTSQQQKPAESKPTDTGTNAGVVPLPPPPAKPAPAYSLKLYFDPRPEAGKPANFRAELSPEPPAGAQVRYCFTWGDGDPQSCQSAPTTAHTYRSTGKYLAAVEVYSEDENLASRDAKLATSDPVPIEAVQAPWLTYLPYLAALLAVLAAAYGTHKVRKMLRGRVTARPDFGRHVIASQSPQSGPSVRIRCVRSGARSTVTFSSSPPKTQEAAHA